MARWIVMGRIAGPYGLRGWVKLISHTEPRTGILAYDPLYHRTPDGWQSLHLEQGRTQGKGIIAKFAGIDDREAVAGLLDRNLAVPREQLPAVADDEYYWTDLEGLRVLTLDGHELGVIDHLFDTGANEVMVIRGERERLVPYLPDQVVRRVDLGAGMMLVDWDPEF